MEIICLPGKPAIFFVAFLFFSFVVTAQNITTIAGGTIGDGKSATSIGILQFPSMVTDSAENLYVLDPTNRKIRRIDAATGIIQTVRETKFPSFDGRTLVLDNTGDLFYILEGRRIISIKVSNGQRDTIYTDTAVPTCLCIDKQGNLYYSTAHKIRKLDITSRTATTIAGTGVAGFSGDGGQAINAQFASAMSVTCDSSNNIYFVDNNNNRIRKINQQTGIITTVVGTGENGSSGSGDGGLAINAKLSYPSSVEADPAGNLYMADLDRIRKVDVITGIITSLSTGSFRDPRNIHISKKGNLYIEDFNGFQLKKLVIATGTITIVCGNGFHGVSGIGGAAKDAQLHFPDNISIDRLGNVYIAAQSNYEVYKIDHTTQIISRFAGTGRQGFYAGNGNPAASVNIFPTSSTAIDSSGNVFFIDLGNIIRKVNGQTGIITTVAGTNTSGPNGDGGPALNARFSNAKSLHIDGADNIYIVESGKHCIRKISSATGIVTTIAGNGTKGYSGDGNIATSAQLNDPFNVTTDQHGNVYISDNGNYVVRKVDAVTGIITTIAGNGANTSGTQSGPATQIPLEYPNGLTTDKNDNLYVADRFNSVIRKIDLRTGFMSVFIGTGSPRYNGDNIPIEIAEISNPADIKFDNAGNIYIADAGNKRIRKVTMGASISGLVYYDDNSNGIKDTNEKAADDISVSVTKPGFNVSFFTNQGKYALPVDTGSYTVKPSPPSYYTITPAQKVVVLTPDNTNDSTSFALQPIPGIKDILVTHMNSGPARAGFEMTYKIYYKNVGTAAIASRKLSFVKDHKFKQVSSSVAPDKVNGDTIVWTIPSIQPQDSGFISVSGTVAAPPITQLGDFLYSSVFADSIPGDPVSTNDSSRIKIPVTGSFDPNDKNETHEGAITPAMVFAGEYLNYVIRFQNTGNDTAFTVMIRDTLSDKVIPESLDMIDASHKYTLTVKDGRHLTWFFKNILLPDSTKNQDASNGFIYFRIKPVTSLVIGDTIKNNASIYFDYNLPIQTNTTLTAVKNLPAPPPQPSINFLEKQYCKNAGEKSIKIINMPTTGNILSARAGINMTLLPIGVDNTVTFKVSDLQQGAQSLWIGYLNESGNSYTEYPFMVNEPVAPEVDIWATNLQITNLSDTSIVHAINARAGGSSPSFTFSKDRSFTNIIQQSGSKDSVIVRTADLLTGDNWIYVKMQASDTCVTSTYNTDSIKITKNITVTGIIDPDNPSVILNAYPNPFKETFFISGLLPSKTYNVVISGVTGNTVGQYTFRNKQSFVVSQSSLQKGYYWVSIYDTKKNRLLGTFKMICL